MQTRPESSISATDSPKKKMPDTMLHGWLTAESLTGELTVKPIGQRRAKRIIPDDEKDDKYWEKRQRNNMAARRSRENKRQLEVEMRRKMNQLEDDKFLLHKEVMALKLRFGLPPDQSFLSATERQEYLQVLQRVRAEETESGVMKMTSADGDVTSTSPMSYPHPLFSDPARSAHTLRCTAGPADFYAAPAQGPGCSLNSQVGLHGSSSVFNSAAGAGGSISVQHGASARLKQEPLGASLAVADSFLPGVPGYGYGSLTSSTLWSPHGGHQVVPQSYSDYPPMQMSQAQLQQEKHYHHHHHGNQQQQQELQHPNSYSSYQTPKSYTKLPSIKTAFPGKSSTMSTVFGSRRYQPIPPLVSASSSSNNISNNNHNDDGAASSAASGTVMTKQNLCFKTSGDKTLYTYCVDPDFSQGQQALYRPPTTTTTTNSNNNNNTIPATGSTTELLMTSSMTQPSPLPHLSSSGSGESVDCSTTVITT